MVVVDAGTRSGGGAVKASECKRRVGTFTLRCNGCDNTAEVPVEVEITTEPLGGAYVKVARRVPQVVELVPDGWVLCEQYTNCTYCAACWAEIDRQAQP